MARKRSTAGTFRRASRRLGKAIPAAKGRTRRSVWSNIFHGIKWVFNKVVVPVLKFIVASPATILVAAVVAPAVLLWFSASTATGRILVAARVFAWYAKAKLRGH